MTKISSSKGDKKVIFCTAICVLALYLLVNVRYFRPILLHNEIQNNLHQRSVYNEPLSGYENDFIVNDSLKQPVQLVNVVNKLQRAFEKKLDHPPVKKITMTLYCEKNETRSNSCSGQCRRLAIDKDIRTRIMQIVEPDNLRITPYYRRVIEEMSKQIKEYYDVIIATASSENHFLESQGLVKSVHQQIVPDNMKVALIYFDLGLAPEKRAQLETHCKCQVLDFPFHKFPEWVQNVRCYTWKPIVLKSLFRHARVIVWADASVRFDKGPEAFQSLVTVAKKRGLQFTANFDYRHQIASRTLPTMFHFFREEACAYLGLGEIQATAGSFSSELLIEKLIIEPWVACALDHKCMCPDPNPGKNIAKAQQMMNDWVAGKGKMIYGLGHRFDQSALNIVVMKLYRERYMDTVMEQKYLSIQRDNKVDYFSKI